MEDRGGQHSCGVAVADTVDEMIEIADAARGYHGNGNAVGDRPGQRDVEALPGAVAVHGGEQDFTSTERDHFLGIFDGIDAGRVAATMGEDLPAVAARTLDPLGV